MGFRLLYSVVFFVTPAFASANLLVTFEDKTLFSGSVSGGSFYNGNSGTNQPNSNGWMSSGVFFGNTYSDITFPGDYWSGWSYSNVVNPTSASYLNQYAAFPGGGSNGSGGVAAGQMYAISYSDGAFFDLPAGMLLQSVDLANGTYGAIYMRDGNDGLGGGYKYGGPLGDKPDYLSVTLNGYDSIGGSGTLIGSVTVDLADYRFPDNSQDYVLSNWQNVSLSSIASARSVSLTFSSSDVGPFGINTPTYLALDNLRLAAVPEPSSIALVFGLVASSVMIRRLWGM
ncbi:MAG: DUF4465 domain-containing protein [Planctomycetota bacterium]|nr:DUF4465 domain-containing protein [Planctomycetota bacterium]